MNEFALSRLVPGRRPLSLQHLPWSLKFDLCVSKLYPSDVKDSIEDGFSMDSTLLWIQ